MALMLRNNTARVLQVLTLLLIMVCGCKEEVKSIAPPSIYLLNHQHWTSVLILNFTDAIAPSDGIGQRLTQNAPKLEPPMEGVWYWQDPSRLAFYPSKYTFSPDTTLKISLKDLKLHPSYNLEQRELAYHTPPLKVIRHECHWSDSADAPLRRKLQFFVEFNYPLDYPAFHAELANGTEIAMGSSRGTRITASSAPLLRPAEDNRIKAWRKPGTVALLSNNLPYHLQPDLAELTVGAECELPLVRGDWDKFDAVNIVPPTVNAITASLSDGKIHVQLAGKALTESVKKTKAGEAVTAGVGIEPSVEGSWMYGDSAAGSDLIFTPKTPEAIKPGVTYQVKLDKIAFPALTFEQPQYAYSIVAPPMISRINNLQLYNDPLDPKIKRVTATLTFSYPPQRDSLAAKLTVGVPAKLLQNSMAYEISYDEQNPKQAYLKTVPLQLSDTPSNVTIRIDKGVVAAIGGEPSQDEAERILTVPGALDYLQVTNLDVHSVVKEDDSIERLLALKTNVALKEPVSLEKAVEVYVLPDCSIKNPQRAKFCSDKDVTEWQHPNQVDADVVKASTLVSVKWRESGSEDKTVQHLTFTAPENRQLFVKVNQGIESVDGFKLGRDARYLKELGANQRELKILHEGALLSLSGNKKLGVTARGIQNVHVELQRVLPHNMHHLASFTSGNFQNPSFSLPIEHFAEKFAYDEALPSGQEMQRQYFAVDFARFTRDKGFPPRGLFILSVAEKKAESAQPCETAANEESSDEPVLDDVDQGGDGQLAAASDCVNSAEDGSPTIGPDKRLVLLTDLGLLVKTAADGKQEVFVMSFRSGQPVAGVQVSLLGKNGVAVFSAKTDAQGKVSFPTTDDLKAEKTPTVYLAEKDGDLSFLPYNRSNRQLDVSRFDIDGLRDTADSLQAYLFSDRGIYRPGDTVKIGLILRKRDWSALPAGLPLKAVISDPENQEVWSKTLNFGAEGFEEISWPSPAAGKTGSYRIELIVADNSKKSLGSTKVRVEEFQPDRLQVKTEIPGAPAKGWFSPDGAKAKVTVRNLFGTPAEGNIAKLELTARPWSGQVPGYGEYRFRRSMAENIPNAPQELGEAKTNAQGEVAFDLPLASIAEPVYEIALAG